MHHPYSNKIGGCKVSAAQPSQVTLLKYCKFLESQTHKRMYGNNLLFTWWKVAPKDNVHSKNRHLCYWRNAIGEAIVSLIQNQQKGGYFEDDAISPQFQGVGIPDLFSYIVQSLLFLQDQIDCCVLIHERRQLLSNEVLQMESATWSVNS